MGALSRDLRNQLARATLAARDAAERGVRAALEHLAVHEKDYRPHMTAEARQLRNRLRARGRALGDVRDERTGTQDIGHLVDDAAYEHWHRLLFTRFLADNNLLHTDAAHGTVLVTLAECEELAPELGARDGFELACRFASETLPGVFRREDPVLELRLAPNDEIALRKLLDSLPPAIFQADDALGWTYQFWQAKRKDEVNASGKKIGAEQLPAVTQLFTEDYMVEFLLHNTLGAWWAGKVLAKTQDLATSAASEDELRKACAVAEVKWTYLRFAREDGKPWRPAAGTFDGWPKATKEIRFLDPCMGSGHFLVFALPIIAALRAAEEGLPPRDAILAALRENLFGLELDARCTQIAAFNLALSAWKVTGYIPLPPLHLACVGMAPNAPEEDWAALAGKNERLRQGMTRLHALFKNAPVLGSLINPRAGEGDVLVAAFHELQQPLEKALAQETKDDTAHEMAVTACGLAKAAEILAGQFTLVATNVPFLGRKNQDVVLASFCAEAFPEAKLDLATCFLRRCLAMCSTSGTVSLVLPQNPLFLASYRQFRKALLGSTEWNAVARLGEHGFESSAAAGGFTALVTLTVRRPKSYHDCACAVDVAAQRGEQPIYANAKSILLKEKQLVAFRQADLLESPDAAVVFGAASGGPLLSRYADSIQGASTLDIERFAFCFWEVTPGDKWLLHQSTPNGGEAYSGLQFVSISREPGGPFAQVAADLKREGRLGGAWSGQPVWGRRGVACAWMGTLPAAIYLGVVYDNSIAAIVPHEERHLIPIWCFCSSGSFPKEVRKINQKTQVANATLVKVPFDLAHWQAVAAEKYPQGLPKPHSDDPTQWLFNGHPKGSDEPLHVAVGRLLGYCWPRQTGSSFPDCPALSADGLEQCADDDGIVCLPPLNREQPAATRLRALLAAAFGKDWSAAKEHDLLAATGSEKPTLEEWLRDEFFEQHCALFHHRPFIWHLWDGRKDGFHALVNYHRLDNATLQKLTYSYLGDWIRQQEQDVKADNPGAAERLGAAKVLQAELAKILEGEPPYDIFVRWKPLKEQPLGWQPDPNDGVRLNIRPFMQAKDVGKKGAGLLRAKPNIKWEKDRGTEPERPKVDFPWFWSAEEPPTDYAGGKAFKGNRWNNVHLSLVRKRDARGK